MARFALSPPLDRFPLVIDLVDVDSAKWEALARDSGWPLRWVYRREAHHLAAFEKRRRHAGEQDARREQREREADLLKALAPAANVSASCRTAWISTA